MLQRNLTGGIFAIRLAVSRRFLSTAACSIADIRSSVAAGERVQAKGWVRSVRAQKSIGFMEVNDGSCLGNLQVVADPESLHGVLTGACVEIKGKLLESPKKQQRVELQLESLRMLGECDGSYPLQKKVSSSIRCYNCSHMHKRAIH